MKFSDQLFKALTSGSNPHEQIKALNALTESEHDFDLAYNSYLDRIKQATTLEELEEIRSARTIFIDARKEAIDRAFAPLEMLDRQKSAEFFREIRELREKAMAA